MAITLKMALALTVTLVMTLLLPLQSEAARIEILVMPGPLVSGHQDSEHECTACHGRFEKGVLSQLCLDCHEEVAADLTEKTGFHGRLSTNTDIPECSQCHTDHKGRDANISRQTSALFDHSRTDFELLGQHQQASCEGCHESGEPRRDAPTECFACHQQDDIHQQKLGEDCASCHNEERWTVQAFDHDRTRFALKGAHADAQCEACHPDQRYDQIPRDCISCHAADEIHGNAYGRECDSCHRPTEWSQARFDHNQTDFKLQGAHQTASCESCHTPGQPASKAPSTCVDCHRADDSHKGRNGDDCSSCHGSTRWKDNDFDHDTETGFPLTGEHADATCSACHAGDIQPDSPVRACISCHQPDDHHDGELGNACQDCHQPEGWLSQVRFDHDLTRFPLYGLHGLAPCESCHIGGTIKPEQTACDRCHENDDDHKGALGDRCDQCHSANSWTLWQFDHDNTDFPLTGQHEQQACNSCHTQAPADETPQRCIACHRDDDAHQGRFGSFCEQCHSPSGFDKPNFSNRNASIRESAK
ncbi:MAG: cytochrome c3 family protein [Oceanobacter sp.]